MSFSPTSHLSIESACGRFEISDTLRKQKAPILVKQSPTLVIKEQATGRVLEIVHDSKEVELTLKSMYYDFHTTEYFRMMTICLEHEIDFEQARVILKDLYRRAIDLEMFNDDIIK